MLRGKWVPIDKRLVSALPSGEREYTELEAAFCVTCDHDNGNTASISGYAKQWRWSRKRVSSFAKKMGWSLTTNRSKKVSLIEIDREIDNVSVRDSGWKKGTSWVASQGQVGDELGTSTGQVGDELGTSTGQVGDELGFDKTTTYATEGTSWGQVGDKYGTSWGRVGYKYGTSWGQVGDKLGSTTIDPDPDPDPEPNPKSIKGKNENKEKAEPGQAEKADTSAKDNQKSGSGGGWKEGGSSPGKKKNPQQQIMDKRPEWISLELWGELIDNRKMKKLSNGDLALTTFLNAIQKAVGKGYTAESCIAEYVSSGWKRFDVEWMKPIHSKDKRNDEKDLRNKNYAADATKIEDLPEFLRPD